MLVDDRTASPKQRDAAHRTFERLRDEHGYTGGETALKDAVPDLKQRHQAVFLPLSHPPGAQVGFWEVKIQLAGHPTKVALFVLTLQCSAAIFIHAFPGECMETFHRRAFEYFGGGPTRISLEDWAFAVTEVLKAPYGILRRPLRSTVKNSRFSTRSVLACHYGFVL